MSFQQAVMKGYERESVVGQSYNFELANLPSIIQLHWVMLGSPEANQPHKVFVGKVRGANGVLDEIWDINQINEAQYITIMRMPS